MSPEERNEALLTFAALPDATLAIAHVVVLELERAQRKHPRMANAHEGYAVILEEMDELWTEVKRREQNRVALLEEAIQVGAMALRFLLDVVRGEE